MGTLHKPCYALAQSPANRSPWPTVAEPSPLEAASLQKSGPRHSFILLAKLRGKKPNSVPKKGDMGAVLLL
jgi:hypothetical protein